MAGGWSGGRPAKKSSWKRLLTLVMLPPMTLVEEWCQLVNSNPLLAVAQLGKYGIF